MDSRLLLFFIFLLSQYASGQINAQTRDVQISQGIVRGTKESEFNIYSFHGIPYATAPKGRDRFKEPLPPPTWTEPFEAINSMIFCPQFQTPIGQVDCLVANVFVPDNVMERLRVLVFIHGGSYVGGFGNQATFKNLINTENTIVVTFNYRLAIHGFLCLGTRDIPGNAGTKDQLALLRWVKNNIAAFGGNPDDITLYGSSAGSASAELLMLSKHTEGLFNKVILDSGSTISEWGLQMTPVQYAQKFAQIYNSSFTDIHDLETLEEFFKESPDDILSSLVNLDVIMGPCVERDVGQEMIISESPVQILKSGNYRKLPVLAGFANMEGLILIGTFDLVKERMNENFSNFLPRDLYFENEDKKHEVSTKIKQFYFGERRISTETILGFVDYISDINFNYPMLRAAKLQRGAGNNNVFLYEYVFVDDDTPYVPHTNVKGATHCAQSFAVADEYDLSNNNEINITAEYKEMKRIIRRMWINFIETGKPVINETEMPAWPVVGVDLSPHMSLDVPPVLKGRLMQDRVKLWEQIYDNHYLYPKPPQISGANTNIPNILSIISISLVLRSFIFC